MFATQPIDLTPPLAWDTYVLAALNTAVRGANLGVDASSAGNDGTPAGNPTPLPVGVSCEGTDDTIDFGDIGDIQQVSMWVNPGSATEQLFLLDAGNYVHLVAGTVTYVGLTAAATYVNGVAGTTLAANQWQMLVCQFTQIDADNFELAVDGAGNFGDIDVKDLRAMDAVWLAARCLYEYRQCVPDDDLRLWLPWGDRDYSRFEWPLTFGGGVVVGHRMLCDGTDDFIDAGDIGLIQQVSMWIDPESTTEQILQIDAGKHVVVNAGTVTYTGLTAAVTYVDGVASTTLAADVWQHLVCQFTQDDADNFELGREGANYGEVTLWNVRAHDRLWSAAEVVTMAARERRAL